MNVANCHESRLDATLAHIGALIDALSSRNDVLWPRACWPAMRFDGPLAVGARGGHGPIGYVVEHYDPGRRIRFRFTAPAGFDGVHELSIVEDMSACGTILRHELRMRTRGLARLSWPLLFRPLHDALIEDAFASARHACGMKPATRPWSPWVRLLRFVLGRGRSQPQSILCRSFSSSELSTLACDPHRSAKFMRV